MSGLTTSGLTTSGPPSHLHSEDHLVHLPLQSIVNPELVEQVHHVRVRAEKDVQARLDPVTVLVLPRGDFPAEDIARLVHNGNVAGFREVLGAREARETAADDGDLAGLGAGGVGVLEFGGEGFGGAIGVRVLNIWLREVGMERREGGARRKNGEEGKWEREEEEEAY